MNLKKVLKYGYVVVTSFLAACGVQYLILEANKPNRFNEPVHSFFFAECSMAGLNVDTCTCIEDKVSILDDNKVMQGIPMALDLCKNTPE